MQREKRQNIGKREERKDAKDGIEDDDSIYTLQLSALEKNHRGIEQIGKNKGKQRYGKCMPH
jgi:hypothetical protein